jgi:Zn ribbon nucleic-acid-binding protein
MNEKRCPKCGETDINLFGNDKTRKDGKTVYCKKCGKKQRREDRERHLEKRQATQSLYHRTYYAKHREEKRQRQRAYRASHPEKMRTYRRRWYAANPEKVKAQNERRLPWRRDYEKQYRQTPQRKAYLHQWYRKTRENVQ